MHKRKKILLASSAALMSVAAACGSTASTSSTPSSAAGGGGSGGGGKTITVGLLTDITGPAASGNKTSPEGVKAGEVLAKRAGYTVKLDVADTQTSPAEALSAAQKLVEQDHVNVVVAVSSLTFAAANFLKQQNVPVVGVAEDGPEWITDTNMFSVYGPLNTALVTTTAGKFFKLVGATTIGSLGYSISPSSAEAAETAQLSAKAAGLKAPYMNDTFPFGSTNVAPVAIAMKNAGVNGFTAEVDPNTGLALITALRQEGVNLKAALLPTGYGGDLTTQGGPGAEQAAQGAYFLSSFEPVEMHTSATKQFQADLKAAGVSTEPTYAEYAGYASMALLTDALKADNGNTSSAALIKALGSQHNFTAAGLFGSHHLDMAKRTGVAQGVDNCYWVTQWKGTSFHLIPNADPICGTLTGQAVTPPAG